MSIEGVFPKRGSLIVFEGCDRAGKTTQLKRIVEMLNKDCKETIMICFPNRKSHIGKLIDCYLKSKMDFDDHVIHLLFAANRWEMEKTIRTTLEKGVNILVDRYSYSGVAFSAAKKNMSLFWCKQSEVGLPRPDLVVFLEVSAEAAGLRSGFGNERYEDNAFQDLVRRNYKYLEDSCWIKVSTEVNQEALKNNLDKLILNELEKNKEPLETLWTEL